MFRAMARDPDEKPRAGTTHFGFREVDEGEKAPLVRGIFSSVATRYDLMNDLMSGGVHRLWKDEMVGWLRPRPGWRVVDVAGGTGDIAFRLCDRLGSSGSVTVCDLTYDMLRVGRDRAMDSGRLEGLQWICPSLHPCSAPRPREQCPRHPTLPVFRASPRIPSPAHDCSPGSSSRSPPR